mgnify:CR=1 FL=1
MTAADAVRYSPVDRLFLWLLLEPRRPVPIGELNLVRTTQGVSLRYADSWLRDGFPLSEDLPLIEQEFLPPGKGTAAGAVDDARPDRWGEQVIRVIDKPPRLSLLEYLYFAGDDRFGALGVSTSAEEYLARRLGPLPTLDDVDQIHELVRKIQANEPVPTAQRRLISPGVTMGGAWPKGLLEIDGEPLFRWADAATAAGDTGTRTNDAGRTLSTDHLAPLVMGLDLATARLVLASLDIHELLAGQAEHEVSHG